MHRVPRQRRCKPCIFVCEKYNDSRINWQEMEGENSIHDILKEQGMKKERLDALFIFS